jgi:hypothetical protein
MPKYQVVGYWVQNIAVEVEADTPEEAEEMGYDLLCYAGEGVELDGAWQDEIDVMEIK